MTTLGLEYIVRMERVKAWLRLGVLVLAGVTAVHTLPDRPTVWLLDGLWVAAVIYAIATILIEPYRRIPLRLWDVTSGLADWAGITVGIVATGGEASDLYLLYFLSVLSVAMRYSLREVVIAAVGTVAGYKGILYATAGSSPTAPEDALLRIGVLLLFGIGGGLLAREAHRQFRARTQVEAQRRAVQEVTASVSHDLKNPLTAITGLVEILLDSTAHTLSADQRMRLHRIEANARQMHELVSNVLDAELIEHGRQPFRPGRLDVNSLVRRVVEVQAYQAEVKRIGVVLDLSSRVGDAVVDARMIERLVSNLVNNAITFAPDGGAIRVSTRRRHRCVAIEVWDSGSGIPDSLQTTLFGKYVRQADSAGVGLGLYICKSVVDMHGGRIWTRMPTSGGMAFVAELPIAGAVLPVAQPQRLEFPAALECEPAPVRVSALARG